MCQRSRGEVCAQRLDHTLEAGSRLVGDAFQRWIVRQLQHRDRIGDGDHTSAIVIDHNHIAGQQQPNLQLGGQRLVRERRVTGAENDVVAEIGAKFLFERLLDIDLGQNAEPWSFNAAVTRSMAWA